MRYKSVVFDKTNDLAKAYVDMTKADIKDAQLADTYLDSQNMAKEVTRTLRKFYLFNDTGKDIEIAFITSDFDADRFEDDPTAWGWLRVKNGAQLTESPVRAVTGVLARSLDGTATTNDLRIDLYYP